MKIGITVDDIRVTKYEVGRFDFYTRQMDVDPAIALPIQKVEEMYALSQRILSSLYNSNGRFVNPEDVEKFKCLTAKVVEEQATHAVESAKTRRKQASAAPSNSELPTT